MATTGESNVFNPSDSFIKQIVENDLQSKKHETIITRFPPEPNGFLHLGHAKSICLNFGLARTYNGRCHLRFDDTNPTKEETLYIESIQRDVRWIGGDWGSHLYYASDYFEQLYNWAVDLINAGLAFVDDESIEEIRRKRGNITTPGIESTFRNRSIEENLDLFKRMRNGEFDEGHCVLRAKIDMSSSNMNMRDPILYRILKQHHPRTGDAWCIYPMYDYAHGQSDSIENITHSICTLEFELHRPLYEWFQEKLGITRTRQIEFARLNVTFAVMSKRKLLALVTEKYVDGWDDPRLFTISSLRRRGVPAAAIQDFCERVGVARRESTINLELLDRCIRECLHTKAYRRFAIADPIPVFISNWGDSEEVLTIPNHPENPEFGTRNISFSNTIYIERDDFLESPPAGFHRLSPGAEVRLKYSYWIRCTEVEKDGSGNITRVICTVDRSTKDCQVAADGRKAKGTIHWLGKTDAVPAELRMYSRLFNKSNPEEEDPTKPDSTWRDYINKQSLVVRQGLVEKSAADHTQFPPQKSIQFERVGFFTRDGPSDYLYEDPLKGTASQNSTPLAEYKPDSGKPVFNLTISLLESYSVSKEKEEEIKMQKQKEKENREKASLERQKKREEREARNKEKLEKEKLKREAEQ